MLIVLAALVVTPLTIAAPAAASATPYAGHGADSVSATVLEKFRAPALSADVSRTVQNMLDVRSPGAGALAPDGKRLFFSWWVTGVRQVWRLDKPMGFPVQLTGGEDKTDVVDITPDGTWLVLQRDQKGEENPGLYLQRADGGPLVKVQHLPKVQTQFQHLSDDGKTLWFRSNDVRQDAYGIYRFDIATMTRTLAFDGSAAGEPGVGLWALHDVRPGFLLLAREVGSRMAEYFEYDLETRTLAPLFGQGERQDYVARYGRGDDVLVLTNAHSDVRRLYQFDRKSKALAVFSPESKWDVRGFDVDRKKTRITASENAGGFLRPLAFDAKTLKPLPLPKLPNGDHVAFGASTPDGRFTTLTVDPGTAPAKSFVLEWKTHKLIAWHEPSAPEIDLSTFVPVSLESYPARDGTQIPVLVRRPEACAQGGCPVILDFHGGPEVQALAGFSTRAQLFVDAGFVYAQPNVRGSDGYGKAWVHADDGAKRKAILTDVEDAAKYARTAWKAKKVGIFGGSYGGYTAMMGMTYFAGAYDAGVGVVGISSLVSFLENTAPYRRALRISEYGDPEKDRAVLTELSPITHVAKTKGPMLLIQGATDPRVPVGESIQMHAALEKKGLSSKLIVFPDEGHGVQKRENNVLLLGHALAFFNEHLK
jgi:dipeptidyl aminopeptidase/acylaminoacyl peptidase